jgi:hypothetical protein
VKCEYCGAILIYDLDFSEWVCPMCGTVADSRPMLNEGYFYPQFIYYAKYHRSGRRELFSTWLIAATEHVKSLSLSGVYSSECTFETAIKLVYEVYSEKPHPPAEGTAKLAVLAASRLCGETVEFEKLFSSTSELNRLLRYKSLRRLYKPPSARDLALHMVMKATKCLEKRGIRVDGVAELVDKFVSSGMVMRPKTLAVLVLYNSTGSAKYLAECLGVSYRAVREALRRYSHLF